MTWNIDKIHSNVSDYYGTKLSSSSDLQTNACCTNFTYPDHIKKIMGKIHDEVMSKYYGCGLTIPSHLKGMKVLDLGSGSGRDCFILSALVGEDGEVVGVDMTDAQLAVANAHVDFHSNAFGHKKNNVRFLKGTLEDLDTLDLPDDYFDIIISNCVINLVTDKQKVLDNVYRKLKKGGEFYFSDVYVNKRIPQELVADETLYGECLSGALYWNDFVAMSKKAGFLDPRAVESDYITISNPEIEKKLKNYVFVSTTYRLFKIEKLEAYCEDYGQAVKYLHPIDGFEDNFRLDDHHNFEKGRITPVCGNTFRMLNESRLASSFEFYGDFKNHFGIFEGCGQALPFNDLAQKSQGESCC